MSTSVDLTGGAQHPPLGPMYVYLEMSSSSKLKLGVAWRLLDQICNHRLKVGTNLPYVDRSLQTTVCWRTKLCIEIASLISWNSCRCCFFLSFSTGVSSCFFFRDSHNGRWYLNIPKVRQLQDYHEFEVSKYKNKHALNNNHFQTSTATQPINAIPLSLLHLSCPDVTRKCAPHDEHPSAQSQTMH